MSEIPPNQNKSETDSTSSANKTIEKIAIPSVEDVTPKDITPILNKLDDDEKGVFLSLMMSVKRTSWKGPIPPPEILQGYNDCFPGGAEKIFNEAQAQSRHRMDIEKSVITRELDQSGRGQNYAFILALVFLIAAVGITLAGYQVAGTILGTVDIIGLCTVFIVGKYGMKKELESKKGKPAPGNSTKPDS